MISESKKAVGQLLFYRPRRQAQRPAEEAMGLPARAKYNQLRMHVCTCMFMQHCGTLGTLSKLTRRPRGGGHIQISIQLKSE